MIDWCRMPIKVLPFCHSAWGWWFKVSIVFSNRQMPILKQRSFLKEGATNIYRELAWNEAPAWSRSSTVWDHSSPRLTPPPPGGRQA